MYKGDGCNPHQNININISYNLNTDKLPKSLFGKKINKINKLTNHKTSPDIQQRLEKKNAENIQKKSNQIKKVSVQGKKMKKKINNQLIRNSISPQLCLQRKLKTQGSCPQQMTSTFKKQHKLKKSGHLKSIQTNFVQSNNKSVQHKKVLSQSKTPKNSKKTKQSHNKSCMLYSTKKQLINLESNLEGAQHIISTCLAAPQRKRIQSAITFKNDKKIVSKFLNMSLISSELGGSQLVSSDRLRQADKVERQPHRALKQYLNSIDMRIMKNIEQDAKIINQRRPNYQFTQKLNKPGKQSLIKDLMKLNNISLEQLQKKVIIIQRKFRKCKKKSVLSFYKQMFQKVSQFQSDQFGRHYQKVSPQRQFQLQKKFNSSIDICNEIKNIKSQTYQFNQSQHRQANRQSRFDQISDIQQNSQRLYDHSQGSAELKLNLFQNQISQLQIGNQASNSGEQAQCDYEDRSSSLNFQRYKELVQNQIKQNKKKQLSHIEANRQNLSKFKEQQIEEWNNINKLISSNMRQKGSQQSNNQLLDKLIEQSKLNKQWIQQEISANQTLNNSHQVSLDETTQKNRQRNQFVEEAQLYCHQDDQNDSDQNLQSQKRNVVEIEDSLTMIEQYDSKKYSLNLQQENIQNSSCEGSPSIKFTQSSLFDKQKQLDRRWINRELQLMGTNFIQNENANSYLDCSLNGFGINLNYYPKKEGHLEIQDEKKKTPISEAAQLFEFNDFVKQDQSIHVSAQSSVSGQQQLLHDNQGQNQNQKNINQQIKKKKLVRVIEDIILDLIRQFAFDISSILKKNSGISINKNDNQVKNAPAPQKSSKIMGVNTSYVSVKEYLQQFKAYILQNEQTKKKILNNINKDIGPNSLEILSYLRPQVNQLSVDYANDHQNSNIDQNQNLEDQEGLFVVPSETFQQFEDFLEIQFGKKQTVQLTTRQKAYLNFWHRSVFQSFNQYLDFQRPYGITGKPYDWISQKKKPKTVLHSALQKSLQKAIDKLLQSMMFLSGIIFQKIDSSFAFVDEQNRQMINEQRLSRMLATELFQSQESWINYNDQSAELQVQLSRMIQEKIFFEVSSQLKRLSRRRKLIIQQSGDFNQQKVQFEYEQI